MAGRKLKLHVFGRRIFIAEVSGTAVNIMSFINIGYGLNRTDRRVKIKIAHISVIICINDCSDGICIFLKHRRYVALYHS